MPKHPSKSGYFRKKTKTMFGDMGLTAGGSYNLRNSWSKLEEEQNLQGWSNEKLLSLGVIYFGLGIFKGCNTLLWRLVCRDLRFFQSLQDKPNFNKVFKKAFPPPLCFFFFQRQTTDRKVELLFLVLRYPAQRTDLELLPEPLQNKICYRLHSKYISFSCFPIICSPVIWRSFFYEIGNI